MHHSSLREALRRQPFIPFRLILSNGNSYDIRSPEWMLVTGMHTMLGIPGESADGEIVRWLDNAHINELVALPGVAVAKSA